VFEQGNGLRAEGVEVGTYLVIVSWIAEHQSETPFANIAPHRIKATASELYGFTYDSRRFAQKDRKKRWTDALAATKQSLTDEQWLAIVEPASRML
jgi:hypothetical protein